MVLEIKNLVKRYGEFLAVDNLNLSVKEGEIFGLLGPNGAGKTTTINTIAGLTKIDSGEVRIFGKDINKDSKYIKSNMGIVPQDIALYEDLTAYENLMFFAKLYGFKGEDLRLKVKEALEFTGLLDRKDDLAKQYSGGMKRRLNIACAIVHRPKLIIMDEPTVGIDPQSRNHILQCVKQLNSEGVTIIYTSHYMEEVEALCNNVAIMDKGRVIAKGSNEELKSLVATDNSISIQVTNPSFTLVDKLKNIEGVKQCEIVESEIKIICEKHRNIFSQVVNSINHCGGEVIAFNVEKPTLESVFLTLTGRKLRD